MKKGREKTFLEGTTSVKGGKLGEHTPEIIEKYLQNQIRFLYMKLFIALILVISGLILCIVGVVADTRWMIQIGGFKMELTTTIPGVVFAAAGTVLLITQRMYRDALKVVDKERKEGSGRKRGQT